MLDQPRRVIAAACDGACSGNPGPGGWGALLRFEDGSVRELGGADPATTNNRMELTAALAVYEALQQLPRHPELVIRTDSRYLIDGLQKWLPGWKRKGWRTASGGQVLNRDLWERLERARLADVRLVHVRGHSGDLDNDHCDAIAVAFARGQRPQLAREAAAGSTPALVEQEPPPGSARPRRATSSSRPASSSATTATATTTATNTAQTTAAAETTAMAGTKTTGRSKTPERTAARASAASASPTAPPTGTPAGRQPTPTALGTAAAAAGDDARSDLAPVPLQQLLTRLEMAERLAQGGFALSLLELAQLVEMPLRTLENRSEAWTWRDWRVQPAGEGRWRLERDAGGLTFRE